MLCGVCARVFVFAFALVFVCASPCVCTLVMATAFVLLCFGAHVCACIRPCVGVMFV